MNAVDRPGLVTTLALLQAFFGAVSGLLAVGSLLAAADSGEMGVVALVFGVVAALCLACAQGLWTLEPRGRHLQLWLAGLWLVCIPVGTVLGGLILYYLFQPKMRALFQGRPPSLGLASE